MEATVHCFISATTSNAGGFERPTAVYGRIGVQPILASHVSPILRASDFDTCPQEARVVASLRRTAMLFGPPTATIPPYSLLVQP